jgi:hypothetical protein
MNGSAAAGPKAEPPDSAPGAIAPGAGADVVPEEEVVEPPYNEAALDRLIQLASSGDVPAVRKALLSRWSFIWVLYLDLNPP